MLVEAVILCGWRILLICWLLPGNGPGVRKAMAPTRISNMFGVATKGADFPRHYCLIQDDNYIPYALLYFSFLFFSLLCSACVGVERW